MGGGVTIEYDMCTIAVFLVRICATQHGHTKDIVPFYLATLPMHYYCCN